MEFYERIKEQVAELKAKENYQNDGTAFGHFIIKECFSKIIDFEYDGNDFDHYIKDHIVDMANDLGNDAIFTNQANNEILVFQFKYSKNQLLNTNEIKKNKRFVDWIIGLSDESLSANHKLQKVIDEELSQILTPQNIKDNNFYIIFYYIDVDFKGNIKTDINALHTNYRDKSINFNIRYYSSRELEDLYDDIAIPNNEVELRFVENEIFAKKLTYYDDEETQLETVVTSIYANSLKPIIEDKKELLLASNVRYHKGENEINSKIKKEYSKGGKSNFWILNNGINGVCQDYEIIEGNILRIKNFQIVNGGQTAKTLTRIVNDLPDKIQILLRLTKVKKKTKTSKISMDIAVATNSQNAISTRDLHSGDRMQTKIFEHLDKVGIFYDKKDGEWAIVGKKKYRNPFGKNPMHLKISNTDLGVAYLSFFLQMPISTVGRHKLVFSDLFYDKIFDSSNNEDDQFLKLMLAYRIGDRVNEIKNEKYAHYEILWSNYINNVLLSLSALYFYQDKLQTIKSIESLSNELADFVPKFHIYPCERYALAIGSDFDDFVLRAIQALQYLLDVMKQAKKFQGEEWLPNDTNKWLKKDGSYREIFEVVLRKLKEG